LIDYRPLSALGKARDINMLVFRLIDEEMALSAVIPALGNFLELGGDPEHLESYRAVTGAGAAKYDFPVLGLAEVGPANLGACVNWAHQWAGKAVPFNLFWGE
jgi:hypothetical protein